MISAFIEVTGNNGTFSVEVYAENLRRAVDFAADRYPNCAVSVRFPLEPEKFFVKGHSVRTEAVEPAAAAQHEQGRAEVIETSAARRQFGSTVGTITGLSVSGWASQ